MDSSSSPPQVKSPLPMIPVPQALETVLSETAKSLWFSRVLNNDDDDGNSNITPPPHSPSSLLPKTPHHHHEQLIGRISAKDIMAPSSGYPNHNSSIMDGYAVKTSELGNSKRMYNAMTPELREKYVMDFVIVGKVYAGDDDDDDDDNDEGGGVHSNNIDCNQCTAVYVTTGAVIPTNYDAVIPIEDTAITSSSTTTTGNNNEILRMHIIPSKIKSTFNTKPWTWVRPIGCDIPSEYIVLSKGETIEPVHLALLAQVGVSLEEVHVKKLPRVGVLSTGNEVLLAPSSSSEKNKRAAGKIPDANRPLLLSQLSTYGNCIPIDLGIVSDDEGCENTARRLNSVLWDDDDAECKEGGVVDVLITTGGISMGEKDMMEQVLVEGMGGEVHFGRMNMKPGKPTTFITIGRDTKVGCGRRRRRCQKLIFALPGNPVSASVCSELLVRPCLDLLHDGVDTTTLTDHYSNQDQRSMESFTKHAVENAKVHEEVMATITSDIKLDQGRPEYRRVVLQRALCTSQNGRQQYAYHATHTGVQRSSRVLSLRGADGFMMLPRGGPSGCGYDIARKGAEFPVLLHSSLSVRSDNCWKDSMHRGMWKSENGDDGKSPKLKLGVIVCTSYEQGNDDFRSIDGTLVDSLGGDGHVTLVQKFVCKVPSNAENNEEFTQKLSAMVISPQMEGTNAIFVVVPTDPLAEDNGSSAIAFRAGLEVSHALRPILTKNASAMALQIRKHAAAHDPVAALFENVVGIVRNGSAVLITCSDRGLEGAAVAVKGLLGYLTSLLTSTD